MLSFFLTNSQTTILLPFKRNFPDSSKITSETFTRFLLENYYFTDIKIGSNKQKIPMRISFDNYHSFVTIYNYTGNFIKYNPDESSTYQKLYGERYFSFLNIKKGINSKERFTLKDKNNKDISLDNLEFVLATEPHLNISGDFGMSVSTKDESFNKLIEFSFILNLYKNNYINHKIFTIIFTNKNSGEIIIGDRLDEYLNMDYNSFIESYIPVNEKKEHFWGLEYITSSINGKKLFIREQTAQFLIESYIIKPHSCYKEKIDELFFNEQIKNNKCIFVNETIESSFYHCDKNIDLSNFPKLDLYQRDFNFTFELTANDLFEDFGGRKYFLMNFNDENSANSKWVLGQPFLKKYNFSYNFDSKSIGMYFGIKESQKKGKKGKKFNKMWIVVIICSIIIIILGVVIYFLIQKIPRKKRVNELEENFDYKGNKIENERNNINSDNNNDNNLGY